LCVELELSAKIQDPDAKKPEDWDERPKIGDPTDVKPEGWDDIPATIPDAEATKPEDWDDEEDGGCLLNGCTFPAM
jgi:calreticulin